jgi:hypothetical protein
MKKTIMPTGTMMTMAAKGREREEKSACGRSCIPRLQAF